MHSEPIVVLILSLLFILVAFKTPVAIALGFCGFLGLALIMNWNFAFSTLQTLPFHLVSNYSWAVFPLFVLVGAFTQISGLSSRIFEAGHILMSRFQGGLYLAVIVGSAGFAAASGSTMVNAVVFTRIALPEMQKYGYSKELSLGAIAASGTFAAMIPPSLTMVIYAVITEQSIGKMLLAGIIPGILSATLYIFLVVLMVRIKPELSPLKKNESFSRNQKINAARGIGGLLALITVLMGGIYAGVFPPSQAGAVAAFLAFVYVLIKKAKPRQWFKKSLKESASIASSLFLILIGGALFSRMVSVSGVVESFVGFIHSHIHSQAGVLILFSLMYLILGSFLDTASMMIITLPFVFPVILQYQIHPIWFGVIFVKLIEIAVITPPIGLNLYAVLRSAGPKVQMRDVVVGTLPFLIVDLITLGILITFPVLSIGLST